MAKPKEQINRVIGGLDGWQRRHRIPAISYGMIKKFGDDNANLLVVALGLVRIHCYLPVAAGSGHRPRLYRGRLVGQWDRAHPAPVPGHRLPVQSGPGSLPSYTAAYSVSLSAWPVLLYGAQGVTQTAEQAMARVWNVPANPPTRLFAAPGSEPREAWRPSVAPSL